MKRVFILLVIQIIFLGVLSAQKMTRSSEYDFYAKKKLWRADMEAENEKEVWERLTAVEQSTKSAHHRLDSLDRLTESVHILATETKAMREDVSDITSRVDEIEKRPTKRYETVVGAIITVLVGAVIGYVVKMLGF